MQYNGKIIVVDDNKAILKTLQVILSHSFKTIVPLGTPTLLPALLGSGGVDVVLLDMNFEKGKRDGKDGLFWLERICEYPDPPAVILMTAFGEIELAVAALKRGAADFVVKPWDNERLVEAVLHAWRERRERLECVERKEPRPTEPTPEPTACTLEDMERQFIAEVLKEKQGNLTSAALQLNISRQTLYNKIQKYNLSNEG